MFDKYQNDIGYKIQCKSTLGLPLVLGFMGPN